MVISFSRTFGILLFLLLTGIGGLYYYKTYHKQQTTSYQLSDQKVLVHSRYGFPLLSLDKSIEDKESKTLPFILKKLISPDARVLHLGTHAGLHTILIGKILNNKGSILAFEGHPKLFALLKGNLALHNLQNTTQVFPIIPASKEQTLSICFDAEYPTQSDTKVDSAYEQTLKGQHCQDIPLKPLDNLSLPKVDFILIENNIDMADAVEGAYHFLHQSQWPPLLIVVNPLLTEHKNHKWLNRLKKEGYYLYKIIPMGEKSFKVIQTDPLLLSPKTSEYLLLSKELLPVLIDK